jgi:hypothetical protein
MGNGEWEMVIGYWVLGTGLKISPYFPYLPLLLLPLLPTPYSLLPSTMDAE